MRQTRPFRHLLGESDAAIKAAPEEKPSSQHDLRRLHQILSTRFVEDELRTLCFYLSVDFDSLGGKGTKGKARELLAYLAHRNRISELVETSRQLRPDISWDDVPQT